MCGLLVLVLFAGCTRWEEGSIPKEVDGWKPVYQTDAQVRQVEYQSPRPMSNPGKIMTFGNFLMVTEKGRGIHLVDNSNPGAPRMVGFLSIPGCSELHFRSPILYTDNYGDLISVDLTDPTQPRIIQRLAGAFPAGVQQVNEPPRTGSGRVYFECVDPAKGVVVGWERTRIKKPECYLR